MATVKVKDGGVAKTMTIVSVSDVNAMFDIIYPVGSYAFGVMPALGTWEEVVGDRALWLKNTVDDGTLISQALPNIKSNGNIGIQNTSEAGFSSRDRGCLYVTGSSDYSVNASTGGAKTGQLAFNAARSNGIYKDGANVQPNAYVMKVYKRVA